MILKELIKKLQFKRILIKTLNFSTIYFDILQFPFHYYKSFNEKIKLENPENFLKKFSLLKRIYSKTCSVFLKFSLK
jgi:hypothetical protein